MTQSLFVMLLGRLGSLNALEQTRTHRGVWRQVLGEDATPPSADTLARVQGLLEPDALRGLLAAFYARLRRNKALPAPAHGLLALVIDGHETVASYRRCCSGCLQREVAAGSGTRTQYYHRYTVAMLAADEVELLVDLEPQLAGEDEVAGALRLLARVAQRYPRAFDVVLADALYARTGFVQAVRDLGKDAVVVLKQKEWDLTREVEDLAALLPAEEMSLEGRQVQCWDLADLPWTGYAGRVRAVRTTEVTRTRRQLTRTEEERVSSWVWITTLERARASTRAIHALGHRRWGIENQGFNEAVGAWHLDHVYRHEPRAMLVMLLLVMLAFNLLHVFYERNLKPVLRNRASLQHVGRLVMAEIYGAEGQPPVPP